MQIFSKKEGKMDRSVKKENVIIEAIHNFFERLLYPLVKITDGHDDIEISEMPEANNED